MRYLISYQSFVDYCHYLLACFVIKVVYHAFKKTIMDHQVLGSVTLGDKALVKYKHFIELGCCFKVMGYCKNYFVFVLRDESFHHNSLCV